MLWLTPALREQEARLRAGKRQAVEEGAMKLIPYLHFNGECEAAFRFCEPCLGGRIVAVVRHGETPAAEHVSPGAHLQIAHARLVTGDAVLMGSDGPPGTCEAPQGFPSRTRSTT